MTTPNSNLPIAIITDAMFDAGLLRQTQQPSSSQIVTNMRKLNDVAVFFQTQGLKLWLNEDKEITLEEDVGTYDLGPSLAGANVVMSEKPLRVLEAYYSNSEGIRQPLIPLAWADYVQLSQISQSGALNSYFINKKQNLLSVFFWLIPDATAATGTAHLIIQRQVAQVINITTEMNFPIEWRMALRWGLAADICTGQPQAIIERCTMNAEKYRMALEDWDVEDAPTSFSPDPRSQYTTGSFR